MPFLVFSLALTSSAFAYTVTFGPNTCTSTVANLTSTITFNGLSTVDPAGHATYSGAAFDQGSDPGCGGDWLGLNNQSTTITFNQPIDYFGLAWGSADSGNSLQLFNGAAPVGATFLGGGGNLYVNFFAGAGEQFTRIVLSYSGCCFETDNHSYRLIAATGVPEPASFMLVGVAVILPLIRRRFHS